MKIRFLVLIAAIAVVVSGCMFFPCVSGSGIAETRAYGLSDFTKIEANQSFAVTIVPDASYSVQVTFDDNLAQYLSVSRSGSGVLCIELVPGNTYVNVTLNAVVHMPALSSIDLSGASKATVQEGFSPSSLAVELSGASSANIANITAGALSVDLSGASSLTAAGTAVSETVHASGASAAHLLGCATSAADVTLSGASRAWIAAGTGTISLSASGASTLYYSGSPSLTIRNLSGASSIQKVD